MRAHGRKKWPLFTVYLNEHALYPVLTSEKVLIQMRGTRNDNHLYHTFILKSLVILAI